VEKLCDVVGVIHDGRLLEEGTVPALRAKYGEQDLEEIFVRAIGAHSDRTPLPPVLAS
jgi:sodium transport system ATP-binding protein